MRRPQDPGFRGQPIPLGGQVNDPAWIQSPAGAGNVLIPSFIPSVPTPNRSPYGFDMPSILDKALQHAYTKTFGASGSGAGGNALDYGGQAPQSFDFMSTAFDRPSPPDLFPIVPQDDQNAPAASLDYNLDGLPASTYAPIPASRFDGKGALRRKVRAVMSSVGGEPWEDTSLRLTRLREFERKIDELPDDMTPDEADQIFTGWLYNLAPERRPDAAFGPEFTDLVNQAYGPTPVMQTDPRIDRNSATAVGAYLLARMLTGNLGGGEPLRALSALQTDAQRREAIRYQNASQQDQANRARASFLLDQLLSKQKYDREQAGYEAKDLRDTMRQIAVQGQITDRADQSSQDRERAAAENDLRSAIVSGDPQRVQALADLYERQYGAGSLPDSVRKLSYTATQNLTNEKALSEQQSRDLVAQKIRSLGLHNDLEARTLESDVQARIDRNEITAQQLSKITEEAKIWPQQLRSKMASEALRAQAAMTAAKAALLRAQNAGASKSTAAEKERIGILKAALQGANTSVDNKAQRFAFHKGIVDKADMEILQARTMYGEGTPEFNRVVAEQGALKSAHGRAMEDLAKEMLNDRNTVDQINRELARLAGVGGGK